MQSQDDNLEMSQEGSNFIVSDEAFQGQSALNKMMTYNFLEFASYVIKDRAIPDIGDGMKPVQRRILHSLNCMDDGKFHKVANVVGHCMQYHPHGDSSIYHALVNIANREYFIEKQGNFGNVITGDEASAARYIECRLSDLARETLFNKEITQFIDSYDGRNQEPLVLPAKVPVLLMQGTEGIAVGMATKILPHNFNELLKAQIAILRGRSIEILPDFIQGGLMDASDYNHGRGRVIMRAKIDKLNKKTLVIREIPAGTTTESVITSIEDAVKANKIKLSNINDYTTENVEIELTLARGVDAERTLNALYAYTACEQSLSSNVTIIQNARPLETNICEVLFSNTQNLVDFLGLELQIACHKALEKHHDKTLEQIFIEKQVYKRIEKCESSEAIIATVGDGLKEYRYLLRRDISTQDIERLLRIPIRRISVYDINKMQEELSGILTSIYDYLEKLTNLKQYTIDFLKGLLKRYGSLYPRKTQVEQIQKVDRRAIALVNTKFGYDKKAGYIGTNVRGGEAIRCTEFDKFILVFHNGSYKVINILDKLYIGRFHSIFKVDKQQVYSMVYTDKKTSISYHKRFYINKFILEKEYRLCPKGCKIDLLETNYGIVLDLELEEKKGAKISSSAVHFDEVVIRDASARGFKSAHRKVAKFLKKKRGSEKSNINEVSYHGEQEQEEQEANTKRNLYRFKQKIVFEQVRQKDFNLDTSHLDRSKVKGVKQVWSKEKSASVQESEQEGQFAKKGIQPRGQVRAKKFVQTQVSTPINSSAPPIPALPEDNPDEAIDKQRSLGIEE